MSGTEKRPMFSALDIFKNITPQICIFDFQSLNGMGFCTGSYFLVPLQKKRLFRLKGKCFIIEIRLNQTRSKH